MKKVLFCLALSMVLSSVGCANAADGVKSPETVDFGSTGQSKTSYSAQTDASEPQVTIRDSMIHYFAQDNMLYAAVVYENTNDVPVVLSNARFTIACEEISLNLTEEFMPIAADYDVVQPGERAYCTIWMPTNDITQLVEFQEQSDTDEPNRASADSLTFKLDAELTCEQTEREPVAFSVTEPLLVQNYPNFATFSGNVKNDSEQTCTLNVIYAAFYDTDDHLLGVWHFTRNATLAPGDSKSFVVHLQALPIADLVENTARIEVRAFGLV